jgi:site-specific DNA-methyltransferase (adenine-specific)
MQVFQTYNNGSELLLGDCISMMHNMPGEFIDAVCTSPPYNANKEYEQDQILTEKTYGKFTKEWLQGVYHVLKPGAKLFVNIGYWSGSQNNKFFLPALLIEKAKECGFTLKSWITWVKNSLEAPDANGSTAWGSYLGINPVFINGDEVILYFIKPGKCPPRKNDHPNWKKYIYTPWVMPSQKTKSVSHPAAFPVELPYRCLSMVALPGDYVLDPFVGSGSTAVAAKELGLIFIGIDKEPSYLQTANKRILGN